jgi:NAD(P)H-dependent flavin oxidoreductase YrpB (nitropropane dioxygenase family)
LEGNLTEGELEIGQVSARLSGIETAAEIIRSMMDEFHSTVSGLGGITFR